MQYDVLEILFETGDGEYKVWSDQDETSYDMSKADLDVEVSRGHEVVGEY